MTSKKNGIMIERTSRLTHSLLWDWMYTFYDNYGINAWSTGLVPNFITTNVFFARSYARFILSYLKDCFGFAAQKLKTDLTRPIYIIELGAGHGKFGFLVLKKLMEMKEYFPKLTPSSSSSSSSLSSSSCVTDSSPSSSSSSSLFSSSSSSSTTSSSVSPIYPFKYILTDFTNSNVNFWRKQSCFSPFVEMGVLDFAKFDAECDTELNLLVSKQTINCYSQPNPILVVANYVFDTLRHDAFHIVDGHLQEALVSLISPNSDEIDMTDPSLIGRCRQLWTYKLCSTDYYSGRQSDMNPLLKHLTSLDVLRNSTIIMPVGAFSCIRNLLALANNRLTILSADKAYIQAHEMKGFRHPHIALHGSFSMMMNYYVVQKYFESLGGFSRTSPYLEGLKVAMFSLGAGTNDTNLLPDSSLTFQDHFSAFGIENFSTIQRCVREETPDPSLPFLLSVLRLSCHDPEVFFKYRQQLLDKVLAYPYSNDRLIQDIKLDLNTIYGFHYPLNQRTKDLAFEIARVCMALKDYLGALWYFSESLRISKHCVTLYNMGLCFRLLGQLHQALLYFSKSVELNPHYAEAKEQQSITYIQLNRSSQNAFSPMAMTAHTQDSSPELCTSESTDVDEGITSSMISTSGQDILQTISSNLLRPKPPASS
eukprot:TRINITY_DN279_c0_g4_i1.p1 TRINITY_DN279_c0_g4~~TRINITY_DN279_c0_g4_i1.p1  ORF type:complete len:650 (-),score=90.45 TRINITY_DN279_c0_g4_i1:36-1985(-)